MMRIGKLLWAAALGLCAMGMRAQVPNMEVGASAGIGIGSGADKVKTSSFSLFSGYRFDDHLSAGLGLNYAAFSGRTFPSGIDDRVFILTGKYRTWRPFVYTTYDFLPNGTFSPFVMAKAGYGFFPDSEMEMGTLVFGGFGGSGMGDLDIDAFKKMDHHLGISGGVGGSLEAGVSRKVGKNGSHVSLSVSYDVQPVTFRFLSSEEKKVNSSLGLHLGYRFH